MGRLTRDRQRGSGTVETVLILSALIAGAFLFRDGLDTFTGKAAALAFGPPPQTLRMTFGGEVRGGDVLKQGLGGRLADALVETGIKSPLKGLFPASRALPYTAGAVGSPDDRSPERLDAILDQFNVATAGRYQPTLSATYCNIFAWDATRALGAEIPHWVSRDTGAPYAYDTALSYRENAARAREMTANALFDWLEARAGTIGYREATQEQAREAANAGRPAVAIWKNPDPGRSGHIVVLRPHDPDQPGSPSGTYVAQAGLRNSSYLEIGKAFGGGRLSAVRYYIHQ